MRRSTDVVVNNEPCALYAECSYYFVLCKVSSLFRASYTKCHYYVCLCTLVYRALVFRPLPVSRIPSEDRRKPGCRFIVSVEYTRSLCGSAAWQRAPVTSAPSNCPWGPLAEPPFMIIGGRFGAYRVLGLCSHAHARAHARSHNVRTQ